MIAKLNEGFIQEDLRRKHGQFAIIDLTIKNNAVAFINKIPRIAKIDIICRYKVIENL